ncbi:MAG: gliding motility lipoprotein GldB [Leeuwenhoekiella sp.]
MKTHIKWFFYTIFLLVAVTIFSCKQDNGVPDEIAQIPVNLKLERFDLKYANVTAQNLPQLMKQYPYLFPAKYDNDFWQNKLKDTLQIELNKEVAAQFPDFDDEMSDINLLYKHILYYYPKTTLPKVVTVTSDVDYRNKVILADSLLLISLDTYLGSDHPFYAGIQQFYAQNLRPEQVPVDIALAFAKKNIRRPAGRRFLDEMIYEGKLLYLMQNLLTQEAPEEIISYTPDQYKWAEDNEVQIWTYFVERELLFDTDSKLLDRFINPGPFSKFYLEFDNDSPPRLGRYIGWQIVKSYMESNNIPLQMLAKKSTDEIFENAKYKPRK